MVCPRCGRATPADTGRCAECGAGLAQTTIATGVIAIDTTGLPPGATFGASTGVNTLGPGSTVGEPGTAELGEAAAGRTGPLKVGQAFGPRYHIIKLLGVGGMGAVYQAWDAELGVAVALKVIRVDRRRGASPEAEKRFKNELLLARQVTHKNVVRIHDLGEIDGIKYITMPYVQGDDLATVLRRDGKVPIARALRLARQIGGGLQAAHEAGVVHRDLKPPNIMIGGAGDDEQALIMDFGISASTAEETAGAVVGTLEYMSPEQGTGQGVDARSDLYAFGLILFELLVGPRSEQPKTGQERVTAMKQRFDRGVPLLRTIDESLPEPLAALVARCVERDPAARFQTTAELVAALERLDDAGELIPEPKHLTKPMMAAAAVLLLTMAGATYVVGKRSAPVIPKQHDPVSVLVADFANRTGDTAFEGALEETLKTAIERASYVSVMDAKAARILAKQLAPATGERITPEAGQLIARREGIKVLLTGAIDKTPSGYRVTVEAADPATNKPLTTTTQDASSKDRVLPAVAAMAAKVREALGESKTEMAKLAAAETFTTSSADAMRAYAKGQELADSGRYPEAIAAYQDALTYDPTLGRAYAGLGAVYNTLKHDEESEKSYAQAIKLIDRMTDREKYRTLGGYYFNVVHNYEQARTNYDTLVKLFPTDKVGLANLAYFDLMTGNMKDAVEVGKRASDADPNSAFIRYNYAMYAMYGGDFQTGKTQGEAVLKTFYMGVLPAAQSTAALGDYARARDLYARAAAATPAARSVALLGDADIDIYLGRYRDAVPKLRAGIAADEKAKAEGDAASKYVALAEAYVALGQVREASAAAAMAASKSRQEAIVVPAARVLIAAGLEDKARALATTLDGTLQTIPRSYAKLIEGDIASHQKRFGEAVDAIREGTKRYNSWLSHYLLGTAYASASHYTEALDEFQTCIRRRGEATDVFFSDTPTLRYLPPAYYWLARSQQEAGATAGAKQNFDQFITLRAGANPADPLVADAKRRLASLP